MALSTPEISWIEFVAGKDIPALEADQTKHAEKKDAFLQKVIAGQLASVRDEIDEAQKLIVTREEDPNFLKAAYRRLTNSDKQDTSAMKWRADDEDTNQGILAKYELRADVEVDTVHDIDERTKNIPMEDLQALEQSFLRIKEIERSMKLQFDDNGEPLFTDEDIRNELWTPLVRSGLIPDNLVPDAYSEHAVAFAGAKQLYQDKIDAFTATHSKRQERLKKGLRIGKEVVTVAGALVAGTITAANADNLADKNAELKDMEATGSTATDAEIQTKKDEIAALENMSKYAEGATILLTGTMDIGEMVVDHHYADPNMSNKDKWLATIQKGLAIAQTMAVQSITMGMTAEGANKGLTTCITCAVNAGFTGARMLPSFAVILREPDSDKRAALITGLIGDFASAVADSINAVGGKIASKDGTDEQKAANAQLQKTMQLIASSIKTGIVTVGQAPLIAKAIEKGDTKSLGMLLGGAALAQVLSGLSEMTYDGTRKDVEKQTMKDASSLAALAMQDQDDPGTQDAATATAINAMTGSISKLSAEVYKGLTPNALKVMSEMAAEIKEDDIEKSVSEKQAELAKEEIRKALTPEAMEAVFADADAEVLGFEQMYSDAFPDPQIGSKTPEEIVQAQVAIDRAMANTAELRMRVALINGATAGVASVMAAILPGTGAVVAAQKLVADIYALKKCVDTHNAWVSSMEVAMAGQGGSAAAIQNTLKNAKIHLSHASIKLVLDTLKASAEVARVFDPTGAATATSAGASMASAVVEFGYKMHHEAAIDQGWKAYKRARENPGDRKMARKALRMNSTLAKCCIAYGASIMGDPAAQNAIRATGLTVAALKNDKDICVRLISYLENELNEDPEVLKVDYRASGDWHPGNPRLDLESWTAFKGAARKAATPKLAADSLSTPGIDRLLASLGKLTEWSDSTKFEAARKKAAEEAADLSDDSGDDPDGLDALLAEVKAAIDYNARLGAAFAAYAPRVDATGAPPHDGMAQVGRAFATLARAGEKVGQQNLALLRKYPNLVT